MEAANLAGWFAPFEDSALDAALVELARAPSYATDPRAYEECALGIRRHWPSGGESLGVATWVYGHEPTTGFATSLAKYFTNSLREDGLLAIARSGVVYAPGGAGTEQEIFADSAQNSLNLEGVRSPMVFFGTAYFGGEHPEPAAVPVHAGVAAPYAHVTAPLRRLGDRYANEIVLAACAGTTPPEWSTAAIESVATAMQAANHHSAQIERAVIAALECVLLLPHVGERFEAVVVDRNEHGAIVQLTQPAVVAAMTSDAALGECLTVRLESVDPVDRRLQFRAVSR